MKLHEFQELVKSQRQAQQLTNLEKIAKIVETTKEKEIN
jgi:phage terminase Nu1 subunit (DNA packaging protein)